MNAHRGNPPGCRNSLTAMHRRERRYSMTANRANSMGPRSNAARRSVQAAFIGRTCLNVLPRSSGLRPSIEIAFDSAV